MVNTSPHRGSAKISIDLGGPLFVLFIVFLVLKLTGVIGWSWWWVTAPLWGGLVLLLAIWGVVVAVALLAVMVDKVRR